jgi:hypothetical protein
MAASLQSEAMDVRLIAGTGEVLYSFKLPQKIS